MGVVNMTVMEYASPLGLCCLADRDGALAGMWFLDQKYFPDGVSEWQRGSTPVLEQAKLWLDRYYAGERPLPEELPLDPQGSAFRREVWQILCRIPYGSTTTYAAIAAELARNRGLPRMSAQAVGGAVGHNPISVIIPCHRVLGTNGSLTGYAGGLARKEWLLRHEGKLENIF